MCSKAKIVASLSQNQVSAMIVAPFPSPPNPASVHDRIAELGGAPSRAGVRSRQRQSTHQSRQVSRRDRALRQGTGFVGVVLETVGHAVNPIGNDAQTVFEVARELRIPVVVHPGGAPFGSPASILPRARSYSDVKIVLANAGAGYASQEAQIVAREASNVYLSTAWGRGEDIKTMIADLGANRVMLGSDYPANQTTELSKYRALNLFQFQQLLAYSQTAMDVFGLQGVPEPTEVV